jgi:putative PIN family toxin of toxin-antitoxin system
MRIVVDTNVFISAALKEKSLPAMAVHIVAENGRLLKSTLTERELFVTLARPRLVPLIPPRLRDWLRELLAAAELVTITERITACRDPKDGKFLELAISGHADLIVPVTPISSRSIRSKESQSLHRPSSFQGVGRKAGDRVRRSVKQRGVGGGAVEIHLRGVNERKRGGSCLLRPAHREGAGCET